MCEQMTSHLYKRNDGPVAWNIYSHSQTRQELGINYLDQNYAEVEWTTGHVSPEIRIPACWQEEERMQCLQHYRRHMPTRNEMIKWCVAHARNVDIVEGEEWAMEFLNPRVKVLTCEENEVVSIPDLPECRRLYVYYCPKLVSIGNLPKCEDIECCNCPELSSVGELAPLAYSYFSECPKLGRGSTPDPAPPLHVPLQEL